MNQKYRIPPTSQPPLHFPPFFPHSFFADATEGERIHPVVKTFSEKTHTVDIKFKDPVNFWDFLGYIDRSFATAVTVKEGIPSSGRVRRYFVVCMLKVFKGNVTAIPFIITFPKNLPRVWRPLSSCCIRTSSAKRKFSGVSKGAFVSNENQS